MTTSGEQFGDFAEMSDADFDDQLWLLLEQQSTDESERDEELVDGVLAYIRDELEEWAEHQPDVLLVVGHDDDSVGGLFDEYMASIYDSVDEMMMGDPSWAERYGTSLYRPYHTVFSLERYLVEREFQSTFSYFATQAHFYKQKAETVAGSFLTEDYYKKVAQTHLEVIYPEQFTQPWREFFEDMVPGTGYDSDSKEDHIYYQQAQATARNINERRQRDRDVLDEMLEIAGVERNEVSENAAVQTYICMIMREIASDHYEVTATRNGRAERNRKVCEYGQQAELEPELLGQLAHYLDQRYPIESVTEK